MAGDGDPNDVGKRVVLPATFTGGPRYMHGQQSDAMAYVRKFGHPRLFNTMTCNPKWGELCSNLLPGQEVKDPSDIIARIFCEKVNKMIDLLKDKKICGTKHARLYSIKFQKLVVHLMSTFCFGWRPTAPSNLMTPTWPLVHRFQVTYFYTSKDRIYGCFPHNIAYNARTHPLLPCNIAEVSIHFHVI